MNAEKAKEFFSAYFEGTLDRGLREAFERRLESDEAIKTEYRAFERTMEKLKEFSAPVCEPDFDLRERIAARLDRYIHETKPKPLAVFLARWRTAMVAGVCIVAIAGAVLQLRSAAGGKSLGSLLPTPSARIPDQFTVTIVDGEPTLSFHTGGEKTVVVRDAVDGSVLLSKRLDGARTVGGVQMRSPLRYAATAADPKLLDVGIDGGATIALIALPGNAETASASGHGSLRDFVLALANRYHFVVVLAGESKTPVAWDFKDDPVASATESLKGTSRTVEQRSTGVLWIQ